MARSRRTASAVPAPAPAAKPQLAELLAAAPPPAAPKAAPVLVGWAVLADCTRYAFNMPVHHRKGEFLKATCYDAVAMERDIEALNLPMESVYD